MGKFVYQVEDYTERGIFFQSPIQKVYYDVNEGPWFPRGLHALLNLTRYFKCKKAVKEVANLAGFDFKEFAWPIYFTRKSRTTVVSKNGMYEYTDEDKANTKSVFVGSYNKVPMCVTDDRIIAIHSYGYEPYKNHCAGHCAKETTTFFYHGFKDGMPTKHVVVRKKSYLYTYESKLREFLNDSKVYPSV